MGKVTGFLEVDRQEKNYQPAADRIRHFREFTLPLSNEEVARQAGRCMECGIPFCHTGCPVNNQIPDWNDLVYSDEWEEAARNLHSTNNFPEFTGRICPAPCEAACTLNLEDASVTIKTIEQSIADKAWDNGWVFPAPPKTKSGKSVAVIGSGPSGLAAAQQLGRAGHDVHVYERQPKAGGLLRYGIPDFKMEKHYIDRRVMQMESEGVIFHYGVTIGVDQSIEDLRASHDAVLICAGAEKPRDPKIPGMDLSGVHYAVPFLVQQNRRIGGEDVGQEDPIFASGKNVVVIGGGDTGSDCIGTSFRQGALQVTQLEILPIPPLKENKDQVWPYWPTKFRTSSSQAEGAEREYSAVTLAIVGDEGQATHVKCARVDNKMTPIPGTEFLVKADLVFIAVGFAGPTDGTFVEGFDGGLKRDARSNILANTEDYRTSVEGVYSAGDVRRGQSLVVWAIREGRQAARSIDLDLMGTTVLPR